MQIDDLLRIGNSRVQKNNRRMKLLTYSQYCKNVTARNSAAYIHTDDGRKYLLCGKWYSEKQFNEKFPIKGKLAQSTKKYKGENPDSKSFA